MDRRTALSELRRHEHEVNEIKCGLRSAPPPVKAFDDLCDYWIENRAPRKRSEKDDKRIIRKHLRPAFGAMKLRATSASKTATPT